VYPDVPNDLQSLDEICDYLADLLQPVAEKAKRVEIQIGDSELYQRLTVVVSQALWSF